MKINKAVFFVLLITIQPAYGFYEWQNESLNLELRGLFRGFGLSLQNPDNSQFYSRKTISAGGVLGRLMLDINIKNSLSFEAHLVQSYLPLSLQIGGSRSARLAAEERSSVFSWSYNEQRIKLEFDRLNLQYSTDNLSLKVGRQPVNLATTYFFTPNDFFSPFAAQTFYRAYKAGVDAARLDLQMGELSQLSLISVLSYKTGTQNKTIDWGDSALLARASTVINDSEWAILAGRVKEKSVVGFDFQGEFFEWLGVRAEGHWAFPDDNSQPSYLEFALGLEHRFENTLSLRLEQFYHGSGAAHVDDYLSHLQTLRSPYLAQFYTALGVSYEITPLLIANVTLLYNGVDSSSLLAIYTNYSLSNESEIALNLNLPLAHKPDNLTIKNEFGLYPRSISLEYRLYF